MNLKEIFYEGVNWVQLATVAGSRERSNKQAIFLKGGKLLKNLSDCLR
jgi:hypothetical protein